MMYSRFRICCAAAAASAFAAHSEGAHVHGEAQAAVVIEGASVSLMLTSAMYNITGFERAPKNQAEAEAYAEAVATLERAGDVFRLNAEAACISVSVEHSLPPPSDEAPDADADHKPYRDLEATYVFDCDKPDQRTMLAFPLFEAFERLETLDVVVLVGDRQIADELGKDNTTLAIK